MKLYVRVRWFVALAGFGALLASTSAPADVLKFDFKLNQGATGVTFAELSMTDLVPGVSTQFSLTTKLAGGQGNPEIVELLFGCAGCNNPTFTPTSPGVVIQTGGTQSGYNFDFRAVFDPDVNASNGTRTWTANAPLARFRDATSGSGPDAFALIQLSGGTQQFGAQNISSGFYIAAVPEPETYAAMLVGLGLMGFVAMRRRKQAA